MPLGISKKDRRSIRTALWASNPVTFHVLGICSALAVTTQMKTALVMGAALTFVLSLSNTAISVLRGFIPGKIRIIVQLVVISTLVAVADQVLKAFMYDVSKQLSVFVGLIITNCIVMGRAEAYAMRNPPFKSFIDGIGNGLGYSAVLVCVAVFRELLGQGTLLGWRVVPEALYESGYANCGLMVLAPGAFFLLGAIVWVQRFLSGYTEKP
ncbi:MAG TPA: NADH:ubiquinone reductase (Na(+)-transporting) subunit D [Candidatus Omnitrophota bacterium]|nr:NADH:ubiquinone reductase (Na(+)-transporting) subunit D [Candidatus Omnitrophota bacterium]HPN56238.1 NADH:ubiquinone reductase (Na(+)-transporting) subunit D [Candidatus Omnitrophota bacterium]